MGAKKNGPAGRRVHVKNAHVEVVSEPGVVKPREDHILGFMAGRMEMLGDTESPIEDWKYWDPSNNVED